MVFAQENGRPVDPRADWEEWSNILAAAGIEHAGTHAMRRVGRALFGPTATGTATKRRKAIMKPSVSAG